MTESLRREIVHLDSFTHANGIRAGSIISALNKLGVPASTIFAGQHGGSSLANGSLGPQSLSKQSYINKLALVHLGPSPTL